MTLPDFIVQALTVSAGRLDTIQLLIGLTDLLLFLLIVLTAATNSRLSKIVWNTARINAKTKDYRDDKPL